MKKKQVQGKILISFFYFSYTTKLYLLSDENDGVTPKKVVKRRRSLKEDEDGAVDWSMEEYMNQQAFVS